MLVEGGLDCTHTLPCKILYICAVWISYRESGPFCLYAKVTVVFEDTAEEARDGGREGGNSPPGGGARTPPALGGGKVGLFNRTGAYIALCRHCVLSLCTVYMSGTGL